MMHGPINIKKKDLSSYMEIYEEMLRQVLMYVLLAVIIE